MAVFVDFFHYLLLLVFFTGRKFCKLFFTLKGVRFVTFCYFFIACNFHKLFFTVEKGQGLYCIHCARGERVQVDFFLSFFFLLLRGKGVKVNVFFSLDI